MKSHFLAALAVVGLAASPVFAGENAGCCAMKASNDTAGMKMACDKTFAHLDLTAEQKEKVEKIAAECQKRGCTEASMAQMKQEVQQVLTKEQYSKWQSHIAEHHQGKQS